jgi:hypothetical protein
MSVPEDNSVIIWTRTNAIRYLEREEDGQFTRTLRQLWFSDRGEIVWRDVPVEKE